jgi:glycosyltransferase involved in cell wall biosynthesis
MHTLSLVVLALWVLTLVCTALNLVSVPWRARRMPRTTPLVSVIVPARDEERDIRRTVTALLAQTYPALEVIVVDDRSTDATPAILAELAAGDPRLLVVKGDEPPPGWLGKPAALHRGSLQARGELLLFMDADILYAPDAIAAAVSYIEEREVSLLTLFPQIEMHGFWEHVLMPNLAVFLFCFVPLWAANRSRAPLFAIGGGPGNLVRRGDYDAAGGHEALSDSVVDDVALARLLRRGGFRTEAVRASDFVSMRMYHGLGEIVAGFTKNAFAVFGRRYSVAAILLAVCGVFHLLPFALALVGDRLALITVGLITLTRLLLFRTLRYGVVNALLGHPLMIAGWGYIMLRSVWFTGIRRQLHWRGRTYDAGKTRFGAD